MGRGFDGIIAGVEPYDAGVLEQLPGLKCVSRCGVGVDNVDLEVAARRGITVANTPDAVARPVAELALAMVMDLLRRLSRHTAVIKSGNWEKFGGRLMTGKTVAIIGLGRIGRVTAELMQAVGATVVGTDPMPDMEWARSRNVEVMDLSDALARADIVSLHLANDPDHPFQMTQKHFSTMKPQSLLINLARGQFVNEDDLASALRSGHLGGAGLDVYSQEPYTGPLSDLDDVVLTPHVATLTEESRLVMETEATANVLEVLRRADG